ncbi:MAG: hypothetical protein WC616_04895 [Candidatus Omnitrophota bacterium]
MKSKNRINIFYRITLLITCHPWLKLISLILAIILWFYVRGEKI